MSWTNSANRRSSRGFLLIETIIYIGLVGFVLSAAVLFSVEFVETRAKSVALADATRNAKFALSRLAYEVRSSEGINYGNSTFGTNPGVLSVATVDPLTNPTVFSVSGNQLMVSQGGGADVPLTPVSTEVLEFTVEDVADTTHSRSVRVRLLLGTVSSGALEEFSDQVANEVTVRSWKNDGFSGDNVPPTPLPTFAQSAYRWFQNTDSTDVGAPLASQDSAVTLTADGDVFRLRLMLDVETTALAAAGAT
ncbi:MAG: type II secretion system protein, partial [Patescibacteria group bacterium]